MSKIYEEVVAANQRYASNFDKGELPLPPARRFAILTCMDARLDPAKFAGLTEGDAHVIRNAGGRASDDAIRSLVISHKLLGTNEWYAHPASSTPTIIPGAPRSPATGRRPGWPIWPGR
jgi:carbonic anhydrase